MTLLKDNNYKDINVALLSLEADIKNRTGFDTSVIDKQLTEINSRIDKINAGSNNSSAAINDIRTEIENINSKLNAHSVRIESIEQKLSDIFSADNEVTDFNTTTDSGIYYWLGSSANKPGTDYGVLLVNKYDSRDGTLWVNQIAYGTNSKIYFRQNINSGSWTEWKAVAFEGELTAAKVANALTVNGKTYDGSEAVDAGVQTVANGGTGVTTQADINKAFIGNLEEGVSDVTDGTEFVSSYASNNGFSEPGYVNTPYKRKFSAVWNYIKDKISSVLGLTKDNYGGRASTAGTADADANGNNIVNTYATKTELEKTTTKSASLSTVTTVTTKYIKLGAFHWYDNISFSCRLSGDNFQDVVNINTLNGNTNVASICGYYSTNSLQTQAIIVKRGDNWSSDIEIYLQARQITTLSIDVTIDKNLQDRINISESTTAPSGKLETTTFNYYNGMFTNNIVGIPRIKYADYTTEDHTFSSMTDYMGIDLSKFGPDVREDNVLSFMVIHWSGIPIIAQADWAAVVGSSGLKCQLHPFTTGTGHATIRCVYMV